jgi:hypothetical protein
VTAAGTDNLTIQVMARGSLVRALGGLGAEREVRAEVPELIKLAESLGHPTLRTASYLACGEALDLIDLGPEALVMFRKAVADAPLSGPHIAAVAGYWYALVAEDQDEVAQLLYQGLPVARDQLSGQQRLYALVPTAKYALGMGAAVPAAQLLGAWQHHASLHGGSAQPLFGRWCHRVLDRLGHALGPEVLNQELGRGGQLSTDAALELAFEIVTTKSSDSTHGGSPDTVSRN